MKNFCEYVNGTQFYADPLLSDFVRFLLRVYDFFAHTAYLWSIGFLYQTASPVKKNIVYRTTYSVKWIHGLFEKNGLFAQMASSIKRTFQWIGTAFLVKWISFAK